MTKALGSRLWRNATFAIASRPRKTLFCIRACSPHNTPPCDTTLYSTQTLSVGRKRTSSIAFRRLNRNGWGFAPPFSSHVRWCERGAPRQSCVAYRVVSSEGVLWRICCFLSSSHADSLGPDMSYPARSRVFPQSLDCFESDAAWLIHHGGIRFAVYLTRPAVCGCLIDRSSGSVQKVNAGPIN